MKDKDLQRYMDNLMNHSFVSVPPTVAQEISRMKTIKGIRNMNHTDPFILIGHDRKFNTSMIKIREPVKIRKNGDKYVFSL